MNIEQSILHDIPLARSMGLRLITISNSEALWTAPLAPNVNHLGTGFGGSLYCASALAGYSFLLHLLVQKNFQSKNLVIAKGTIQYLKPVEGEFHTRATLVKPGDEEVFFKTLDRKGRARLAMQSQVESVGVICTRFSGLYVVTL